MKRLLLSLVLCILFSYLAAAQDTILKTDGESIYVKVLEITLQDVKYKKFDNPDGPTYVIPKKNVQLITYENQTTEAFERTILTEQPEVHSNNLYWQGQSDASIYYNGYKGAGTGTLVATLLSPMAGLVTAIACSTTTPKESNLNYPDYQLAKDFNYSTGYRQHARKVKSSKAWSNFGIAMGVQVFIVVLALNAQ